MVRVTIKLIDTQAQVQYQEDLAAYREKADKLMEQGKPWPMDFRPPRQPEPLVDSRDKGEEKDPFAMGPLCSPMDGNRPQTDRLELDGTSQQKVPGFDSRWNADRADNNKPFTTPKKG